MESRSKDKRTDLRFAQTTDLLPTQSGLSQSPTGQRSQLPRGQLILFDGLNVPGVLWKLPFLSPFFPDGCSRRQGSIFPCGSTLVRPFLPPSSWTSHWSGYFPCARSLIQTLPLM